MGIARLFQGLMPDIVDTGESIRKGLLSAPPSKNPEIIAGPRGIAEIGMSLEGETQDRFQKKFKEANTMFRRGEKNEDILAKTGFMFGEDNKPRLEIDDSKAKLLVDLETLKPNTNMRLGDLLEHEDFYKVYENLADTPVKFIKKKDPDSYGYFDLSNGEIGINLNNRNIQAGDDIAFISDILHETQHAVQKFERMSQGGDPKSFLKDPKNYTQKEYSEAVRKYLELPAEIEARNVGHRFALPKRVQRAKEFKAAGFDIKPERDTVTGKNFLQTQLQDDISRNYNLSYSDPFQDTTRN